MLPGSFSGLTQKDRHMTFTRCSTAAILALATLLSACAAPEFQSNPSLVDAKSAFDTPKNDWKPAFWEQGSQQTTDQPAAPPVSRQR